MIKRGNLSLRSHLASLLLLSLMGSFVHSSTFSREQFFFETYHSKNTVGFYTQTECGELEIDHVVSLKDAWDSGAKYWSVGERKHFANDRANHAHACKSVNRSKGSSAPIPFRRKSQDGSGYDYEILNWCEYLETYVTVKRQYNLSLSRDAEIAYGICKGAR